jgi:hypothetical protein
VHDVAGELDSYQFRAYSRGSGKRPHAFTNRVVQRSTDNIRAVRGAYEIGALRITDLLAEQRRQFDYQREYLQRGEAGPESLLQPGRSFRAMLYTHFVIRGETLSSTSTLQLLPVVMRIEHSCRITHVDNPTHLVASHCKPWRDCSNEEHLDGENGLLLTPSIDHLFDRGFSSFQDNGGLIVSPVADRPSLERMGIPTNAAVNVGLISSGQLRFLEDHRDAVLLQAVR